MDKKKPASEKKGKAPCACPFCDAPIEKPFPFCKVCGKDVKRCTCGKVIPQDEEKCPDCKR